MFHNAWCGEPAPSCVVRIFPYFSSCAVCGRVIHGNTATVCLGTLAAPSQGSMKTSNATLGSPIHKRCVTCLFWLSQQRSGTCTDAPQVFHRYLEIPPISSKKQIKYPRVSLPHTHAPSLTGIYMPRYRNNVMVYSTTAIPC